MRRLRIYSDAKDFITIVTDSFSESLLRDYNGWFELRDETGKSHWFNGPQIFKVEIEEDVDLDKEHHNTVEGFNRVFDSQG